MAFTVKRCFSSRCCRCDFELGCEKWKWAIPPAQRNGTLLAALSGMQSIALSDELFETLLKRKKQARCHLQLGSI
jgi:hypothetical protein